MLDYSLQCSKCNGVQELSSEPRCSNCGGVLLLQPHLMEKRSELNKLFDFRISDIWKYRELLPVKSHSYNDTLQEGGTPLLLTPLLTHQLEIRELQIKNETVNPTGSFKDRQVAVGLSAASGPSVIAVISSGNVAAAAAAQAARRGIKCLVFVPATAPLGKLIQPAAYGARICRIKSTSSSLIMELVVKASKLKGWCHLSTAGCFNPFSVEGSKTIAYELYEQYRGNLPDWILVPVGGGGLLGGLWRGFLDLQVLGLAPFLPRLAGVQAAGCAPLVRALEKNLDPDTAMTERWKEPCTIAGGIADDVLFDAHRVLPAIRDSGGTAVAVTDQSILEAMQLLAVKGGIFAEPSGAASLAGLISLRKAGVIGKQERVCCLVTGTGLKDTASAETITEPVVTAEPNLEAIIEAATM
jgi:threonine synthase